MQAAIYLIGAFVALLCPRLGQTHPLIPLQELGADSWRNTVAVAPVKTLDPVDGLRATMHYFEALADGASNPLLVLLPASVATVWLDEAGEPWLRDLKALGEEARPRWVVTASIDECGAHDYVDKSYWREAGWLWSGRARHFCVPRSSATLHASIEVLEVETGCVAASTTIEETGQRSGAMIELTSGHEGMRCASSTALHAKARGQALRQIGDRLALEVDRLLGDILFGKS